MGNNFFSTIDYILVLSSSDESSGSFTYLNAGGEQTVLEIITDKRRKISGIWLDMVNITQNGKVRIYYKIDGTNYRLVEEYDFDVLTDSDGLYIGIPFSIANSFKITYQELADEGANRAMPYSVIYDIRE